MKNLFFKRYPKGLVQRIFFSASEFFHLCMRLFFTYISGGTECIFCDAQCFVMPLCSACRTRLFSKISEIFTHRCRICGRHIVSEKDICLSCRENNIFGSCDGIFSVFSYRLWNKELLFKWKIEGVRAFSPFFARIVHNVLCYIEEKFNCRNVAIVPVPPRPGKISETGWDQIDELCQFLACKYGRKILPVLQRISAQQQKKLDRNSRLEKTKNAYVFAPENVFLNRNDEIFSEPVIILDDVMTTGATVEKCASLLKSAGFKKVWVLTLFSAN